MTGEERYHQLYSSLLYEAESIHTRIQTEIRRGLWALVGVTVLFLMLMFLTKGSKVIFLLLWIVIMFSLAALLMVMEYVNYLIKTTAERVTQQEQEGLEQTMTLPDLEPLRQHMMERAERAEEVKAEKEAKAGEKEKAKAAARAEKEAKAQERAKAKAAARAEREARAEERAKAKAAARAAKADADAREVVAAAEAETAEERGSVCMEADPQERDLREKLLDEIILETQDAKKEKAAVQTLNIADSSGDERGKREADEHEKQLEDLSL